MVSLTYLLLYDSYDNCSIDMHTCTSVVLFREVSKIISEYGEPLLQY
jgi:hypothetical protein